MIPCGSQHLLLFSKKYQWIPSVTFSSLPSIFRIQTHKAVATAQQLTARVVAIQAGSDANHHLENWKHRGPGPGGFLYDAGHTNLWPEPQEDFVPAPGSWCKKYTKQRLCAHLFVKYSATSCFYKSRWTRSNPNQERPQPSTTQSEVKSNFSISAPGWTWVPGCRKGIIGPSNFSCEFSTNETHVLFIPLKLIQIYYVYMVGNLLGGARSIK